MTSTDLFDAFDASLLLGSGFISVTGPPACGKTSAVLEYTSLREAAFAQRGGGRVCRVVLVSARSCNGDTLALLAEPLRLEGSRRRLPRSLSPLAFGVLVQDYVAAQPPGSELHLIVDDADLLREPPEQVDLWLNNCFPPGARSHRRRFYLWIVSARPLRLLSCTRYHFVCRPSADTVAAWIAAATADGDDGCSGSDGEGSGSGRSDSDGDEEGDTPNEGRRSAGGVTTETVRRVACMAARYYTTRQPMCASVAAQDFGRLSEIVARAVPILLSSCRQGSAPHGGGGCDPSRLNDLHLAAAWREAVHSDPTEARSGATGDSLAIALTRLGLSAVLLAFAAFYCGAVPRSKQLDVFGEAGEGARSRRRHAESNAQSHRAAVLSSSTHPIAEAQLLRVYAGMLRMCVATADPREFGPPSAAAHHLQSLVAWGVLTVSTGRDGDSESAVYRCFIPASTALELGRVLSLSLYDLIPM